MKKIVLAAISFVLIGCQTLPTPAPSTPPAVIKSVEKLKRNTYRVELQGPATSVEMKAWEKEVIIMCHDWLSPYSFSVDLEKASEGSIWFICKTVKIPIPARTE